MSALKELIVQTEFLLEKNRELLNRYSELFTMVLGEIDLQMAEAASKNRTVLASKLSSIGETLAERAETLEYAVSGDVDFLESQLKIMGDTLARGNAKEAQQLVDELLDGEEMIPTEEFKGDAQGDFSEAVEGFQRVMTDLKEAIAESNQPGKESQLDDVIAYLESWSEDEDDEDETEFTLHEDDEDEEDESYGCCQSDEDEDDDECCGKGCNS